MFFYHLIQSKKAFPLLLVFFFPVASCTYGPQTEKKSIFNYVSGEHYEGQGANINSVPAIKNLPVVQEVPEEIQGIPLIYKRRQKTTVITGHAVISGLQPLKFRPLLLKQDDETILETTTDHMGAFKFSSPLPNGEYRIIVDAESYKGEISIMVEKYDIENIIIPVTEEPLAK